LHLQLKHDIVSFSQATACRQILWIDGPWAGKKLSPHGKTITNRKGTSRRQRGRNVREEMLFIGIQTATWKECGFKKLCVLTSLTSTEVPPSPPSPPPSWCCLKCVSPEGCVRARGRRPKPMMTNWRNASKTCAGIPQDAAEHNRRELVAFCQGCWHFTDFRHNKGTIAALDDDRAQNRRTQNR